MRTRRLMAVLAHPDDESMALGGTLAKYAAEGVETSVLCATRGSAGRYGAERGTVSPEVLGRIRSEELRAATRVLGVQDLRFLGYRDGQLASADSSKAVRRIVTHIRRTRPEVVVTFGPDGLYGHPDHVAISQLTTAAVAASDDPHYETGQSPFSVAKLYYLAWSASTWSLYQDALKRLVMTVDGVERGATPWPDWMITTVLDTSAHGSVAAEAVACHHSQVMVYERFNSLPLAKRAELWSRQEFYRAMSTVNGGSTREHDFFEGLEWASRN
jgi:LmbE family N-acetylglucosaminyl deacetylase